MDIIRLKVKKLNGKYDFDINLDRQCTIIVGANGVGKTTILKMIEYISIYDFYELLKYSFDEIVFDYSVANIIKGSVSIMYSDLIPPIDMITDKTIGIMKSLDKITDINYELLRDNIITTLQNLLDKRLLNKYIYDLINQNTIDHYVFIVEDNKVELTRYLALAMESFVGDRLISTIFTDSRLFHRMQDELNYDSSKKIDYIKDYILAKKRTYYLSMVKKITINDGVKKDSFLESAHLNWLHSYKVEVPFFKDVNEIKMENEKLPVNWQCFEYYASIGKRFHAKGELLIAYAEALRMADDFKFEKWVDEKKNEEITLKQEFEINGRYNREKGRHSFGSINNLQDVDQIEIESLMNNNTIHINHLINRFYYGDEFQIRINKEYCQYLADVLDGKVLCVNNDEKKAYVKAKFEDDEFMSYCDDYFNPIISSSVGNKVKKAQFIKNEDYEYEGYKEEFFHIKFAESKKEELMDRRNINPKIDQIKGLLEKYLQDKTVNITPSGLRIYDREDLTRSVPIDISKISSGEVKIIVLLFMATFSKTLSIFIDEPELSLSIAWQEEILQDIINNGECKIVVATHSPYMAGNEMLRDSVSYVPG